MFCPLQSLSILFHYMIQPVSLMFCGSLGKLELASAAMAISVSRHHLLQAIIVLHIGPLDSLHLAFCFIEFNEFNMFSCISLKHVPRCVFQVIYITVVSICRGLAFGGDTFFSQVEILVCTPHRSTDVRRT